MWRNSSLLSMVSLLLLTLGISAPCSQAGLSAGPEECNVLLIGWDGAQREHVRQCIARGELPHLAALRQTGALVEIDISEVTDTKAGWSQILTGYTAAVTGVYSNARFQPIPQGYTVFERLEQYFGPANIATLAVIGKEAHVGSFPPQRIKLDPAGKLPAAGLKNKPAARKDWRQKLRQGTIVEADGVKYLDLPGGPYFLAQAAMDLFENGLHENDKVGARALEMLEQYKTERFFMFTHFADVDSQGHKFGENSEQYTAALISCDQWLGRLLEQLARLGLEHKTLVYVVVDHGFDEGQRSHKDAPYVFMATNDASVAHSGDRMDIAPTILKRLGVPLAGIVPPLDGVPLN